MIIGIIRVYKNIEPSIGFSGPLSIGQIERMPNDGGKMSRATYTDRDPSNARPIWVNLITSRACGVVMHAIGQPVPSYARLRMRLMARSASFYGRV